ncbi:hypothetical protein [Paracoccus alcaliphilus]|uniref:hypothetical protein n=2 Tax=Paracoccus alcaliphilus TaxID=34002 RepID=UPI003B848D85
MLVAEMPAPDRETAGEAATKSGLAPVPGDIGTMRDKRMIAGGRRDLRHVPFQTARAAACDNPVSKPLTKRLKGRGKPHKLIITAVARSLVTIANAVLKTTAPRPTNPVD